MASKNSSGGMGGMMSMGIKRKEMYGGDSPAVPSSSKDYENEVVHPGITLNGKQAEKMGAEDLEAGEYVKQTVIWKVKRVSKTEKEGEKDYTLDLDLVKASDLESVDKEDAGEDENAPDDDKEDTSEGDEGDGEKPSPGLAFILGGKGD